MVLQAQAGGALDSVGFHLLGDEPQGCTDDPEGGVDGNQPGPRA
jgi:hypothetical protein